MMTKAMAAELCPSSVRVNGPAPGETDELIGAASFCGLGRFELRHRPDYLRGQRDNKRGLSEAVVGVGKVSLLRFTKVWKLRWNDAAGTDLWD